MIEQKLKSKDIPTGYPLCFNAECELRDKCMHHQAYLLKSETQVFGSAIYPDAWKSGKCQQYKEVKMTTKAWGFTRIYNNVPHHLRPEARRCVKNYFSRGCGPYYRYHHGVNKLSPREQADIIAILAKYGPTEGIAFDHYETSWDFD